MKTRSKDLRITCFRDGRTLVELANGRLFDGNRFHLRSTSGAVLASPVGCELFSLPAAVDLRSLQDAELFSPETAAKKLRKSLNVVRDSCRRFKVGTKFGERKLLTQSHIDRLKEKLASGVEQPIVRKARRNAAVEKSARRHEARRRK